MTNSNKPVLDYVETEITEFCNLNCKGCADFMNLVSTKEHYALDEFIKDYTRLSELFCEVKKIRLMGGEPLLNEQLSEYLIACRKIFPTADIRIVSNGLLIPKLPLQTLQAIRDTGSQFDISNYPPTRKMFPKIKERLDMFGIKYDLGFPMNYFLRTILEKPADDPAPAFKNCLFTHCHMLSHGKLSPCSYAHCIGRFNVAYGLSYPENDCVDIYSDITGEEILRRFNNPHTFCKCCAKGAVPFRWQGGINAQKADKYDWLVQESFVNTTVLPVLQSAVKKPAKLLRKCIQKSQ
ncbi:MAG: radical SAM protein [Ruminococcaceae bacterium]|nr:radical SAM protein [Oscillospiraceae bacterium]